MVGERTLLSLPSSAGRRGSLDCIYGVVFRSTLNTPIRGSFSGIAKQQSEEN